MLIAFSDLEDEQAIQQQLGQHVYNHLPFDAVSVNDPALPRAWYGGSRIFEAPLLLGAYNHLAFDELLAFLKTVAWEEPACVQLFVQEQWDVKFRLIDLFPEE